MKYADNISVGGFHTGHVQGIVVDAKREYMYFSFTTCLVKTDMKGNIIGTVKGLAGHLGCLAYCEEDGRVYGSLEYKHDVIGASIFNRAGREVQDGFYIAIFDVAKIDRLDMDAEKDKVMTGVYLKEVIDDYTAPGHRYGCSGIDGTTFAPLPGSKDGKKYLYVAYGVYGDESRCDNDYQVILRYDTADWAQYERTLDQADIHTQGPAKPDSKYFVYTGNTNFGIQNLEYDSCTGYMFAAVYRGKKEMFPNYPMYIIDMNKVAEVQELKGIGCEGAKQITSSNGGEGEKKERISSGCKGEVLMLAEVGECDDKSGIYGCHFPYGSTGMISLGDSYFYFSEDRYSKEAGHGTNVRVYRYDSNKEVLFEKVEF